MNRSPTRAEFEDVVVNMNNRADEARINKRIKRGLLAVVALMALMATLMTVANYGLIEQSKESFVDPTTGRLLGRTGKSVEVKSLSSYATLLDLTAFDISTLGQVKHLTLKMQSGLQVAFAVTMVTKVAGSKTIKIFTSTAGDVVTVDGVSKVVTASLGGKSYLVDLGAAQNKIARQRQLGEEFTSQTNNAPRLYSAAEFFAHHSDDFVAGSRRLAEESAMGGFAMVALAAAEEILDAKNLATNANHKVVTLEGKIFKSADDAEANSYGVKVWLDLENKTRVVDLVDTVGMHREITDMSIGQGFTFQYVCKNRDR